MKIKICGITKQEDAKFSLDSGADLIGFINIERSKRMVEISQIKELISSINDKNKVVLVIEPSNMAEAYEKIEKSGISNLQLHSLSPDEISSLKQKYQKTNLPKNLKSKTGNPNQSNLSITRVIGLNNTIDQIKKEEIHDFVNASDGILFDFEVQGKTGGTGRQIPFDIAIQAAKIAKSYNKNVKLFIAGGVDAERIKNEGELLNEYFDYADVNSGVEDSPGIKNKDKITDLMKIKT